ncbi:MAG: hypothetical protein QHC90_09220 [Shinella sp.]|nr:hypothetical protein [Shinella sp.]
MRYIAISFVSVALVSCQSAPRSSATQPIGHYQLSGEDRAAIEAGIDRSLGQSGTALSEASAATARNGITYVCGNVSVEKAAPPERFIGMLKVVSGENLNTTLFTLMNLAKDEASAGEINARCKAHGVF